MSNTKKHISRQGRQGRQARQDKQKIQENIDQKLPVPQTSGRSGLYDN
jgi:hypothetical protein